MPYLPAVPVVSIQIFILAVMAALPANAQVNVLTDNYDNARTNSNLHETVLNKANVNPAQFGKLFSLPVTGAINTQPLYMQGVAIPGKGTHNVVYVATHHNDVYAFDADAPGDSLWHVNLGPSVPGGDFNVADLSELGVMGTPVIDPASHALYVAAYTKENGQYLFRLHALDISTGDESFGGPTVIQASLPGTSFFDAKNGQVPFDASQHLQRPGLALVNNTVYVAFGSHGDVGVYHGWLVGYNALNIQQQVSAYIATPDTSGGSFWQGGRAPAVDENGFIYLTTANGPADNKANFGESLVKLDSSSGALKLADWFTFDDWAKLNDTDSDYGSCGPVLTAANTVIAGGKEGVITLADRNNLGHLQSGNAGLIQSFPAIGFGIFNMAYWERPQSPVVYVRGFNDRVKAFRIVNGRFETTPFTQASFVAGLPYDGFAVSANNSADYSAILWNTATAEGDHNGPGILHAFAASNLSQELWNSEMNPVRDRLGTLAKFMAPTVANGKVYVPTFSGELVVYGLRTPKALVAAVVNAASGVGGSVAPGELVTVYGSGLGPAQLAGPVLTSSGTLSRAIADTQVLFNGVAAPLIYTRSDQVAAIVPNSVSSASTVSVQVKYQGQGTTPVSVSVAKTMPGLFTLEESGSGQGAILNQDATINTTANPAERGSIVVLYGTGQGLSDPDWAEDLLASAPLPQPLSPVSVTIGGQKAEILYGGAAPGLAGLIQINARVPAGIQAGAAVPVQVAIGTARSQPGVTLAVK